MAPVDEVRLPASACQRFSVSSNDQYALSPSLALLGRWSGTYRWLPATPPTEGSANGRTSIRMADRAYMLFASENTRDRKSTRLNSSHLVISYAVFCLKKKKKVHYRPPIPPKIHDPNLGRR